MKTYPFIPEQCISHDGALGYYPGTYRSLNTGQVICGGCGLEIPHPRPSGAAWVWKKGFLNKLFNRGEWIDKYPFLE